MEKVPIVKLLELRSALKPDHVSLIEVSHVICTEIEAASDPDTIERLRGLLEDNVTRLRCSFTVVK